MLMLESSVGGSEILALSVGTVVAIVLEEVQLLIPKSATAHSKNVALIKPIQQTAFLIIPYAKIPISPLWPVPTFRQALLTPSLHS
jgi:hypothetical protein